MSNQPKAPTREQEAADRYRPALVALLGYKLARGNLKELRQQVIGRVCRRLQRASWQTLTLALRLVEGEPMPADTPTTPMKATRFNLSTI